MSVQILVPWATLEQSLESMYRVSQKKVGSQKIIVFHELLSLGCINFKNPCAHHKEEVLGIQKHPQLVKFG